MLRSQHTSLIRTKTSREGTRTQVLLEDILSPRTRCIHVQIIPSKGVLLDFIARRNSSSAPWARVILHHNSRTNASKPNPFEAITAHNSILPTRNYNPGKTLIWMTPRGRVTEIVVVQPRAINIRVDVSTDTAIMDFVIMDVCFSCLDAEPNVVARDIIVGNLDSGDIIHAETDKATWKDDVVLDIRVLRPDGQHAVLRSGTDSILPHICILRSKHSNVEARKALDCKARDFGIFDWVANGLNLLVLAVERLVQVYDLGACDADASLGVVSCEVGARIGDGCTRWNDDSALADEGDTIFSYGKLLSVRAVFDDDLVSSRCFVKCGLDRFAGFDMDSIPVRIRENGVELDCANRCENDSSHRHGELR